MRYLLDGAQVALEKHYAYSTPHLFEQLLKPEAKGNNGEGVTGPPIDERTPKHPAGGFGLDPTNNQHPTISKLHHSLRHIVNGNHTPTHAYDGGGIRSMEQLHRDSMSTARAIQHQLGIYSDGTLVPLTSWQRLWYTNREHWLHSKVKHARKKAAQVSEELERLHVPDRTLKDVALIRSFATEHVSLAYRMALERKFEEHEFQTPKGINPLPWIMAWLVNYAAIGFCLYWVLAWAVVNTGSTLDSWSSSYVLSAAQDIFVYEVTKMFFMYVFTLVSVRPQLSAIRQVINDAAMSYIQHGPAKLEQNDITIVQHFSPACRAASMGKLKTLAAAAILRQINDADYEKCQLHGTYALSTFIYFFMFIMAIIGMTYEIQLTLYRSSL